jgi:hypothetical protein
MPLAPQQALEQRVHLTAGFVQSPQRADGALTRTTGFIAKRLDQMHVGVAAGAGELGEQWGKV